MRMSPTSHDQNTTKEDWTLKFISSSQNICRYHYPKIEIDSFISSLVVQLFVSNYRKRQYVFFFNEIFPHIEKLDTTNITPPFSLYDIKFRHIH